MYHQVGVERVDALVLVGVGFLESPRPAQWQALHRACALQLQAFVGRLAELQWVPLQGDGARLRPAQLQLAGAGAHLQGLLALGQLQFEIQRLLQQQLPRLFVGRQRGAGLQAAEAAAPLLVGAAVGGQLQLAGKLLVALAGLGLQIGLHFGEVAAQQQFGIAQLPIGSGFAAAHTQLRRADIRVQRKGLCALGGNAGGYLGQQAGLAQLAQCVAVAAAEAQLCIQAALRLERGRHGFGHAGQLAQPLQQLLGTGQFQGHIALAFDGRSLGFGLQRGSGHLGRKLAAAAELLGVRQQLVGADVRAQGIDLRACQSQLGRFPLAFGDDALDRQRGRGFVAAYRGRLLRADVGIKQDGLLLRLRAELARQRCTVDAGVDQGRVQGLQHRAQRRVLIGQAVQAAGLQAAVADMQRSAFEHVDALAVEQGLCLQLADGQALFVDRAGQGVCQVGHNVQRHGQRHCRHFFAWRIRCWHGQRGRGVLGLHAGQSLGQRLAHCQLAAEQGGGQLRQKRGQVDALQLGLQGAERPAFPGIDGGIHIGLHGRRLRQHLGGLALRTLGSSAAGGGFGAAHQGRCAGLAVGSGQGCGLRLGLQLCLHAQRGIGAGELAADMGFGIGHDGGQGLRGGLFHMRLQLCLQCHRCQRAERGFGLVAAVESLHAADLQLVLIALVQVVALQAGDGDRLFGRPDDFVHRKGHFQHAQRQRQLLQRLGGLLGFFQARRRDGELLNMDGRQAHFLVPDVVQRPADGGAAHVHCQRRVAPLQIAHAAAMPQAAAHLGGLQFLLGRQIALHDGDHTGQRVVLPAPPPGAAQQGSEQEDEGQQQPEQAAQHAYGQAAFFLGRFLRRRIARIASSALGGVAGMVGGRSGGVVCHRQKL